LLRDDNGRLVDDEEHQQRDEHEDNDGAFHVTSLLSKIEHQALDCDDPASLAGSERPRVDVARRPARPAQLRAAVLSWWTLAARQGASADEGVDFSGARAGAHPAEERLREQSKRDDRYDREEQPLDPGGCDDTRQDEPANDERRDAEEDDEKATR